MIKNGNSVTLLNFTVKRYIATALLVLSIPLSSFQKAVLPPYLSIKLSRDMTVNQVMKSYLLDEYDCNEVQFFKINPTAKSSKLVKDKVYNLPIYVYDYNGKNIRSSTNIGDLDIAKAIQSYNTDLLKIGVKRQSYQESGVLFVPFHILNCRSSRKPRPKQAEETDNNGIAVKTTSGKTRRIDIFGKNYQDVPIIDNKLKNKIFYVEGGHGGPDPGAQAVVNGRTLCEDEYAYDVSLRVARELIKHGAVVHVINRDPNDGIRDGEFLMGDQDEQTYPNLKVPYNQKARLFQRSDAVNELYDNYAKKGITDQIGRASCRERV